MEKFLSQAADSFSHLSLAEKAGFTFSSLCVVGFYFAMITVLVLITKESFGRLRNHFQK